jgi:hypothetical protein
VTPHRGAWILYLNGIEIPCPESTVGYGVWQIPEATFSFPPHELLQRLGAEDRLDVALFYLDDILDPENPEFRLLFEGEIFGWGYTNSPFGRAMTFNATADIAIFTQLFLFFLNTVDAAVEYHLTPQAATAPPPASLFYPASLFMKGLLTVDENGAPASEITRPFEILMNAVMGMSSSHLPPEKRSLPAVNFFSRWMRKRNFQNRFVALPVFEDPGDDTAGVFPIFKAARCASAMEAVRSGLAPSIGERGSIMDVIREVFDKTYTELVMLPTAPALRVRLADGVILSAHDPDADVYADEPVRLANYFAKPATLFAIPPMCNVVFPGMIRSLTYQEDYWKQPTRLYVNDGFIPSVLGENAFTNAALRVGYPPEVNVMVRSAGRAGGPARSQANPKNILLWPEEFFRGPRLSRTTLPAWWTLLHKLANTWLAKPAQANAPLPADVKESKASYDRLFDSYAEYEYFRQRYEQRGGSVDLVWDPYLVPGFPCVVFDTRTHGLDTVGYLTNVTHTLSSRERGSGHMQTSMRYSHGRTLWEMLQLVHHAAVDQGTITGNAPLDPLVPVREVVNDFDQAEVLYRTLFFGRNADTPGKKASFDFREIVGFAEKDSDGRARKVSPFELSRSAGGTNSSNIHDAEKLPLAPLPAVAPLFSDFAAGSRFVGRPLCTLREYISFLYPEDTIESLEAKGILAGRDTRFAKADPSRPFPSATYWTRIRKLRPGPGTAPGSAAMGVVSVAPTPDNPSGGAEVFTGAPAALPSDAPQTRADWDSILMAYREEILSGLPQG